MKRGMDFLRLLLVTTYAGLSACSLTSKGENPSLYVDLSSLQDRTQTFSLLNSPKFFGGVSFVAPPSSATGFSCYAVNVTGPGILDTSLHPDLDPQLEFYKTLTVPDNYCSYRGVVTPPLAAAAGPTEVALPVPPGAVRLVQVVGVNDYTVCASGVIGNEADGSGGSGSRYFEIGRSVVSDLYADQSVSVNLNWPTGSTPEDLMAQQKRAMDCGGGNCGSFTKIGGAPGPASTPLPMSSPHVAQRLDTVPGTYIRRASVPLQAPGGAIDVTATIHEFATGGSLASGNATSYTNTFHLPDSAQTVATFDFYIAGLGYLQMRTGYEYWIELSWSGGTMNLSHLYYASSTYNGFQSSFNGASWSQVSNSDGMVIDAYGCTQ